MSTSTKTPASIGQGGRGAAHEKAKSPLDGRKPPAQADGSRRSKVSGGSEEADRHHRETRS